MLTIIYDENDMNYSLRQKLNTSHRIVNPIQTCQHVLPILARIGASEPVDLTRQSSLSIPVYAISVEGYTSYGKGIEHVQSQASAMMETIERYTARRLPPTTMLAKYSDMKSARTLDPKIMIGPEIDIDDNEFLEWIPGTDLVSNTTIWIPAYYVVLKEDLNGPPLLRLRTTNGIASGNTFDEALCHGLYEVIERDAWTLAWLRSITFPQIKSIAQSIKQGIRPEWDNSDFSPHVDPFPYIALETLPYNIKELINIFRASGMTIIIRNITSDLAVPTFLVGCFDDYSDYYGMGTHLRSDIALIRAITECAQTYHVQRILWQNNTYNNRIDRMRHKMAFSHSQVVEFDSVPSYANNYLGEDIRMLLDRLACIGTEQVIAVDLTHQNLEIPVVRMIVPSLENWSTSGFSSKDCFLGSRGKQCIKF